MAFNYGDDHRANIDVIGGTNATAAGRTEIAWNRYYFRLYQQRVAAMLADASRGAALDVGTSHGNWFPFLKAQGFKTIYGVEISAERASQARAMGYAEVFNCDAAATPLPPNSLDAAVSNDVLVHVLKPDDKRAIFRRVAEMLKPGGVFLFNHASAYAFNGRREYSIQDHCSFATMQDIVAIAGDDLYLDWIAPTYFHWRNTPPPSWLKALRRAVAFPMVPRALTFVDASWTAQHRPTEESDVIYYRFRKLRPAERRAAT